MPSFEYEEKHYLEGYTAVCGCDEAGRGPLCGPVVAAAVILPRGVEIEGLNDSKKLSEKKREMLFDIIKEKAVAYAIAEASPAEIDESMREVVAEQTKLAFDALRLSGYSRFDFIVDKSGKPWCLEANTLPGMTPTSLLPQMAAARGIEYGKLCLKIVELAQRK